MSAELCINQRQDSLCVGMKTVIRTFTSWIIIIVVVTLGILVTVGCSPPNCGPDNPTCATPDQHSIDHVGDIFHIEW